MMQRIPALVLPAFLVVLGACQGTKSEPARPTHWPESAPPAAKQTAQITNEYAATAEVVAIVPEARVVTLRREDGKLVDVKVGEAARNFDQIKTGDTLRVRYKESIAATKLTAGEAARPAEAALVAGRAKPGEKPAGGVGGAVSARVKIESVDREHSIVVFSLASGELVAHRVKTTEGREFINGLAVGDVVQVDCAQALALSVETP
jgi:hypothetical protein